MRISDDGRPVPRQTVPFKSVTSRSRGLRCPLHAPVGVTKIRSRPMRTDKLPSVATTRPLPYMLRPVLQICRLSLLSTVELGDRPRFGGILPPRQPLTAGDLPRLMLQTSYPRTGAMPSFKIAAFA